MDCIEDQDNPSIEHVPLGEWQVIDVIRDKVVFWNADGVQHRLLPKACPALVSGKSVDNPKCNDAFNWPRDET